MSYLETLVKNYLEELGYQVHSSKEYTGEGFIQNGYPILLEENCKLQLDFYNPKLKIAFEVQDFWTHSKTSDSEPFGYGGYKHGPTYHKLKRRLAKEQLDVTVVDLWEDEIKNGEYKKIIDKVLKSSDNYAHA